MTMKCNLLQHSFYYLPKMFAFAYKANNMDTIFIQDINQVIFNFIQG